MQCSEFRTRFTVSLTGIHLYRPTTIYRYLRRKVLGILCYEVVRNMNVDTVVVRYDYFLAGSDVSGGCKHKNLHGVAFQFRKLLSSIT